jgi:hypothetical protein
MDDYFHQDCLYKPPWGANQSALYAGEKWTGSEADFSPEFQAYVRILQFHDVVRN